MKPICAVISLALLSGVAQAQGLSYKSSREDAGGTRTEDIDRGRRADSLGLEWLDLPSNVTHERWSDKSKQLFNEMDANNDGVLSEHDLRKIRPAKAEAWAEQEVAQLFSFWLPDYREHFENLSRDIDRQTREDEMLAATSEANASLAKAFEALGIERAKDVSAYMKAVVIEGTTATQSGEVSNGARSWVTVRVPFDLTIYYPGGERTYNYSATILAMKKFPRHEDDDSFALWEISLGAR